MSLLSIIQGVTEDLGIVIPNTVIGNTDAGAKQLLVLANREGKNLGSRYRWDAMIKEATFTQSAATSQGAMTTVAGTDFDSIINDTMWNRTTQLPIIGPLGARNWQTLQSFPVTGPYQQFRIQNGILYFEPDGANATDTIAFEYKSKNWCESSGGTDQSAWAADTDVGLLDEEIMSLGIIWRWLKRKGLDYAEDFQTYESRVIDAMAKDGGKMTLTASPSMKSRRPGIVIPQGSWSP